MHTVELMEQAVVVAKALGYGVRQEWLGGCGGGACEVGGRKWIFLDSFADHFGTAGPTYLGPAIGPRHLSGCLTASWRT